MNMLRINKQEIDELEKKLQAERELLVGCSTKFGAFERIATRIIPMLRDGRLIKELIHEWDTVNRDKTLLVRAYSEMDAACQQIRNGKDIHPSLREAANQIFEEVRRSGTCFDVSKDVPPCHRVYYKLKIIYVSAITKTWDITFAPSASRILQESSHVELSLKGDADPRYLWKALTTFEECWGLRKNILCISWPEACGEGVEMWLNADSEYRDAYRRRLACDFSVTDDPNRETRFFQREHLEQWVDRLFKEIILILRQVGEGSNSVPLIEKGKHRESMKHMDTRVDDITIGVEKMRGYWEKHPMAKLGDVAKWLDGQVKAGNVVIKSPREKSTYKSWARTAGLQPVDAKVRGKDKRVRKTYK